jgi:ankyrin repeat protein
MLIEFWIRLPKQQGGTTKFLTTISPNKHLSAIIKMTSTKKEIEQQLLRSCRSHQHLDTIKEILESNPSLDVNQVKDFNGWRPLHYAALYDVLPTCIFLVETKNAKLNVKTNSDETAIMLAAKNNQMSVCKYLTEKGANLNARSDYGRTALAHAIEGRHLNICEYLVCNGADLHLKDDNSRDALMLAALGNRIEICKMLILKGARVDVDHPQSALSSAVEINNVDFVRFLSWKGASSTVNSAIYKQITTNYNGYHKLRNKIIQYFENSSTRATLLTLVSTKVVKRLGQSAAIKLLTVDLIRILLPMLSVKSIYAL